MFLICQYNVRHTDKYPEKLAGAKLCSHCLKGHIFGAQQTNNQSKSQIKQHSQMLLLSLNRCCQRGCGQEEKIVSNERYHIEILLSYFQCRLPKSRRKECTAKGQHEPRSENLKHGSEIKAPVRNINYTLTFSRETKEVCTIPHNGAVGAKVLSKVTNTVA